MAIPEDSTATRAPPLAVYTKSPVTKSEGLLGLAEALPLIVESVPKSGVAGAPVIEPISPLYVPIRGIQPSIRGYPKAVDIRTLSCMLGVMCIPDSLYPPVGSNHLTSLNILPLIVFMAHEKRLGSTDITVASIKPARYLWGDCRLDIILF